MRDPFARRQYAPGAAAKAGGEIRLNVEESRHLVRVRRAREGDAVSVFDGCGQEWDCVLQTALPKAAVLRVERAWRASPTAPFVTLAQALPKGKIMDGIVQKATELGVGRIVPLASERSETRLDPERAQQKHERWRATAIEACKQSGNAYLPEITPVQTVGEFLQSRSPDTSNILGLIGSLEEGTTSIATAIARYREAHGRVTEATWLIGPEGDFSPHEYTAARQAGFRPVTFGHHILRVETAAVAALAIGMDRLQEL